MLPVAICGASGYTGLELIRFLLHHPNVRITVLTSEKSAGRAVDEVFPHLKGRLDLSFTSIDDPDILKKAELFFLALPHGSSQQKLPRFYKKGKYIIDLSADYRLKDPEVYRQWYGLQHNSTELLDVAVYGIPEIFRERIKGTRLVANPGCYPTGALLGLYPLVKHGMILTDSIIIDSKSGVSGAGRKADVAFNFCEVNEAFRAYAVATHRHTPEIEEQLTLLSGEPVRVDFTPHLTPMNRGILSTVYCKLKESVTTAELIDIFRKTYRDEPFIRVMKEGQMPDVKNTRGTNYCDIGIKVNERTQRVIVVTAIDNLVKGASGQAVQNMNVMMNFKETAGLDVIAAVP